VGRKSDMGSFVLVPGAWLGGWAWKKVVPLLEEKGHDVYTVTLTGMGERVHLASGDVNMETGIDDVLNVIRYNGLDDVVLVGHSFAGKVVAAAADRAHDKVRVLLYLDAFVPNKVGTPVGGFPDEWPVDGWRVPFPEAVLGGVGKDVLGADRDWMLSMVTPMPVRYFRDPVTLSENFRSVKKAYIFCTGGGDNVDEILKEKLDGPYKVIDSGHWPMITRPEELAEYLVFLADVSS